MKKILLFIILLLVLGNIYAVDVDDAHGVTINTFVSTTSPIGLYIDANTDTFLKELEVPSSNTATRCRIWESTYTTVLGTTTDRSSDVFTFSPPIELTNTDNYFVLCDNNGLSYNYGYSNTGVSFPYTGTNIDFVASSFDGGTQTNRVFVIERITTGDYTPPGGIQLNQSILDYYNTSLINFQVNLSESTELFTVLNGGTNISRGNFTIYNLSLTGIEGNNVLDFYWNGTTTQVNFTIDTTNPVINDNVSVVIGDFKIDSGLTTCTDTNINTCVIEINNINSTLTTSTEYNIPTSGNYTYHIYATDLAGNQIKESFTKLINPYAYIYIQNSSGSDVTNFTVAERDSGENPYVRFFYYNDGLIIGENLLYFERLGYGSKNLSVNITTNSPYYNQSFTVQNAQINLRVFDFDTRELITEDVLVTLVPTNYSQTINTGEINITNVNFINGEYQILLESDNYETESIFFTFDPRTYLEVTGYMIQTNNSNLGVLIIAVEDSNDKISGQLVNLLSWDPDSSAFITVGQSKTNTNGLAYFNVELDNTLYKASTTLNGKTITTPEQLIQISGETITITFDNTIESYPDNVFNDIVYNFTNSTHNASHDRFVLDFRDTKNLVNKVCLEVRKGIISSDSLIANQCVESSQGTIDITTKSNNSYYVIVNANVYRNGVKELLDSKVIKSSLNFEDSIGYLAGFIVLALFIGGIALGVQLQNVAILGTVTIITSWAIYGIFTATISYTVPLLISLVCIGIMYGTYKKRF